MFISYLELKNFKRFTDLTIDLSNLPKPPKLVLLIGANGSGKSSVFDAFEFIAQPLKEGYLVQKDFSYYRKENDKSLNITFIADEVKYLINENSNSKLPSKSFYGRSSLRQVPKLTRTSLQGLDIEKDYDRPRQYIERDNRFENDIEILTQKILDEVFNGDEFDAKRLKERYLEPINKSLFRIFGGIDAPLLELVALKPPLRGNRADVRFKKGTSEIHYDLLSSGEKEVINILLNLFVRQDFYNDTIYFIDELDLHLNTKLQYALLKEITENWIPENCQLWTASHSYGFIDYAREVDHAAMLDFNSLDFDEKHVLLPETKTSLDIFDVAVPKENIFNLFDNKEIILCENQNDSLYNLLNLKNKLFVGVTDKNRVFLNVKRDPRYNGLMDRDFLTDNEINKAKKKYPHLAILQYYCFENYIYHPDNIAERVPDFDKSAYISEINKQKTERQYKIIAEIKTIRNSYFILKEDDIIDKKIDSIIDNFTSDDFESFYKFLDMKSKFSKNVIAGFNLTKEQLVNTHWFKQKIAELLN